MSRFLTLAIHEGARARSVTLAGERIGGPPPQGEPVASFKVERAAILRALGVLPALRAPTVPEERFALTVILDEVRTALERARDARDELTADQEAEGYEAGLDEALGIIEGALGGSA